MITAIVDKDKKVSVKTQMSEDFQKADSIVDGIVDGAEEIRNVTFEMIRQFYREIDPYLPTLTSEELKKSFLDTTLEIVAEKINPAGYKEHFGNSKKQEAQEMIIVPNEKIRKYVAYSTDEGDWIHDPNMPAELEEEFEKFRKQMEQYAKETDGSEQ